MTLRTVTYDDSTHVIVPREPTQTQKVAAAMALLDCKAVLFIERAECSLIAAIAAAPERPQSDIRALIADDAYAITFQTMGQYRSALLRAIDKELALQFLATQAQELGLYDEQFSHLIEHGLGVSRFNFDGNTIRVDTIHPKLLFKPAKDDKS